MEYAVDAHLTSRLLPRTELYFGHFWSLCVEEQFYLLWPWVVFWVRSRRKLMAICAGAVVLVPFARVLAQMHAPHWMLAGELLYRFTPLQLDSLLLGGLVALLWRGPERRWLEQVARILAPLLTLCLVLYLVFVVRGWQMVPGSYPAWNFTGGLPFVNVYSAALIVCALQPSSLVFRLFHVRPLRFVGRLTYGAYVYHDILHDLFDHIVVHVGGPRVAADIPLVNDLAAAMAFPTTLVVAWLSFHYLETPFLNLKERWTIRPGSKQIPIEVSPTHAS